MCLMCRLYIATPSQPVHDSMRCKCPSPVASWDGRTPAASTGTSSTDAGGEG